MHRKTSSKYRQRFNSTKKTTRHIGELLPQVMQDIGKLYQERPDLILASWPDVIGSKLAPMTQALSFQEGVLFVKVMNSTLHSLLSQHDKPRLIKNLRDRFPKTMIKTIVFRMG